MQVDIGFNSVLKPGAWIPVIITLQNNRKSDFTGSIAIETYNGNAVGISQNMATSPQSFTLPILLPHGKRVETTMYIPFNTEPLAPAGVIVNLLNTRSQVVHTRTKMINASDSGAITIGILSDQHTGFDTLKSLNLPTQQAAVNFTFLDAKTLPTLTTVFNNFDLIVLDNFATRSLRTEQISALHTWVNQGGTLLEMGGADWQRTLAPLPVEVRPVTLYGSFELPPGTRLFPPALPTTALKKSVESSGKSVTLSAEEPGGPMTASMAMLAGDKANYSTVAVLAHYNDVPLFVQARQGKGSICYLAADLASPALNTWVGKSGAWTQLLTSVLGDRLLISRTSPRYNNGQGGLLLRGGMLPALEPNFSFAPVTFLLLLLGYVVFLGPVRLLMLRWLKHATWSWRIVLSSMLLFTLVSYGIAFYQKSASLTNNSLSVMQLNANGSDTHTTTYMGVFVPNKGTFNVRVPGTNQVLALADPQAAINIYGSNIDPGTAIHYGAHETTISLEATDTWTYHPMVIEQDRRVTGGVDAQLKLQGENLIGTITNHLTTAISDMYVLMPHSFVTLGHLNAGQKRSVFLPLQGGAANTGTTLLADQIARSSGLPSAYFPYANQGQPQNDFQRHMAQLSILSGTGSPFVPCEGSCSTRAIVNNQSVVISSRTRNTNAALLKGNDPLLLQNTSATLIGWSDQTLDGSNEITINGGHPGGYHDTLLQMPVSVSLAAPFKLPARVISGRVVSTQESDALLIGPNLYTMSKGSVGFEFDFPNRVVPYVQMLSISIPHALNGKNFPAAYGYLQASLYNWQNNTWDKFSLYPDNLNTINPTNYIGRSGNVLLQVTDQNGAKSPPGPIYFDRPDLNLF
ncbi:MAG: hypothetical protein NVSMB44_13990 [Ktedonobacteraceae bacterium]